VSCPGSSDAARAGRAEGPPRRAIEHRVNARGARRRSPRFRDGPADSGYGWSWPIGPMMRISTCVGGSAGCARVGGDRSVHPYPAVGEVVQRPGRRGARFDEPVRDGACCDGVEAAGPDGGEGQRVDGPLAGSLRSTHVDHPTQWWVHRAGPGPGEYRRRAGSARPAGAAALPGAAMSGWRCWPGPRGAGVQRVLPGHRRSPRRPCSVRDQHAEAAPVAACAKGPFGRCAGPCFGRTSRHPGASDGRRGAGAVTPRGTFGPVSAAAAVAR
jgi:hypothetical protein